MYWLRRLFRKESTEKQLDSELQFHLEQRMADYVETGMDPEKARRKARLEFGGMEGVKEECRESRRVHIVDTFLQDVRYGLRMLRKSPGFTLITVLTLALGMGANTTMFSTIDSMLLHPLNFPELNRLVALSEPLPHSVSGSETVAPADYLDWKRQASVFEGMAAYHSWGSDLTGVGEPEHLDGARVSPSFFPIVGVGAALGRIFSPDEEIPGHDQVAVISYGLWQNRFSGDRFSGDPRILGMSISLNGVPYKVVGVMPQDFSFPRATQVWTPLPLSSDFTQEREKQSVLTLARLKPSVTPAQAQAEMSTIAARLEQLYPQTNTSRGAQVTLLRDQVAGDFTPMFLWISMGAVLFVLLIACINVANMQVARAAARQREMAVRASLGATRKRILRQLLTENVMLALLGGAAGLGVAKLLLQALKIGMPAQITRLIPGWQALAINSRALVFTFAIALATGIVFGLAPALGASKPDLTDALKEGEKNSILGTRRRLRSLLVVFEVALALVLLVGAGLMVKGFRHLVETEKQGYSPDNVLTLGVSLNQTRYHQDHRIVGFYRESLDRIRALPEVLAASTVSHIPATGGWSTQKFLIEGQPGPAPGELQVTNFLVAAPQYFHTMRIPILSGRDFADHDRAESPKVAIVSAEFVRRYFSGADPLGQHIKLGSATAEPATIVGVAGDVKRFMFDRGQRPTVYVPHAQYPFLSMALVIRAAGDPQKIAAEVRAQLLAVDKEQPVFDVMTMDGIITEQVSGVRVGAISMLFFGLLALLLSAIGVYGVVAYSVEQRTHEIGIRMAVGARAHDILGMVLAQTARLTGTGLGIGLLGAFAMSRGMVKAMFGMISLDWTTFAIFTALLAGVALLASYIPALRAARVNPMITLRHE
jgi:putative ABC transport system permease protein